MKITSSAFEQNAFIPAKYICSGEGINPPLAIQGVPEKAKSLVLIVDDPDATVSGGFVHWIVFNLSPETREISEKGAPLESIEGQSSTGQSGYVPPCPPSGTHRYFFKLFALDVFLELNSSAQQEEVLRAMTGHILDQAELMGLYKKS